MITVERLSKKYGSKLAVDDLSFTVPDGVVTGFLGPNGSGKSTTMRCMLGLDTPTTGQALFTGTDSQGNTYSNQPFSTLKNKPSIAGAILDAGWHNKARSGRAHLRALARGAGIPDTRVEECLEQVGMTEAAKDKVGGYSLGMKQRLGIALALVGHPRLLILDEPTNGLAPLMQEVFATTLREAVDRDATVLLSSHILAEVQHIATRVVAQRGGQVVADAPLNSFTAVRTVDALVDATSSPPDFTTLEGTDKVRVRGNRVTFEWTGDPNVLVDKLRKCQLTALTVGEPDLEATLRSYYRAV